MSRRTHRRPGGPGRAVLGAVTVVVLLLQAAPSTTGLLASLLHGTFHLTSRTGTEHLEAHLDRSASANRAAPATHTHGPDGVPHSHSATVDAVLEMAASTEGPEVGPTASVDRSVDRYLRPDPVDTGPDRPMLALPAPTPPTPRSLPRAGPPVPPPRA